MTHFLIVDDIYQNLYMLRVILESQGFQVSEAKNGKEALDAARKQPPDLVISDILMPEMDGFALIRAWRKDPELKHIPFIFYTATYTDESDKDFGLQLGADRFLVKPMEPKKILAEVGEVLDANRAGKEVAKPAESERELLSEYNKTIVRKLEKKMRELEREMVRREIIEKELRASEERFKLAAMSGSIGVWDWNVDDNSFFMEPFLASMLGYEHGFLQPTIDEWNALVHPDDLPQLKALQQNCVLGDLVYLESRHRVKAADGVYRWFLRRAKLLTDSDQRRMVGVEIDVTDEVLARKEILMLGHALRSVREFVCITDLSGTFKYTNDALREGLGYSEEALKTMRVGDLFTPHERPRIQQLLARIGLQMEVQIESQLVCSHHGFIPVLLAISLGRDQETITWILTNLTELREKEKQLRMSQKMETIGTMVSGLSHDFNNILLAIYGNVEMALLNTPSDAKSLPYLRHIQKASSRATNLVKQLLTLSRGQESELKPIHLIPLLEEVLKLIKATSPSSVELVSRFDLGDDVVMADSIQMHQVFINLCNNAIHAMEQGGGTLSIVTEQIRIEEEMNLNGRELICGDYIRIQVRDTGCGIPPEYLEKIFEPFFSTKEPDRGTGLGLSVVHGILKRHRGGIQVKSRIGEGSTFEVYLPACDVVQTVNVVDDAEPVKGRERILLVDDEPMLTQILGDILFQLGYRVIKKESSLEALAFLKNQSEPIDLVITDLTMPQMNGIEFAKQISMLDRPMPVILCSGRRDVLAPGKVCGDHIKAVVAKPFSMKEISVAIRKVLDSEKEAK